jgi:hypothetical protein
MRLNLHLFSFPFVASSALAQAPRAAAFWDIPATTLAKSPALETGATAAFWNPAAVIGPRGFSIGAQAIQTPSVLGLSGVLAGLSQPLTSRLAVAIVFGRVEIKDLIRTSTSPTSDPGDIPVYEQLGGVAVGARLGLASIGAMVRGHDARFDVFREGGLSLDLGVRAEPLRGLTFGAATRFAPVRPEAGTPARYYGAVEYRTRERPIWGTPTALIGRYGFLARNDEALEHSFGAGVALASRFRLDASVARESAFGSEGWRAVLAVGFRAGHYDILAARGSGLRGIGANYRVGLEVDFGR